MCINIPISFSTVQMLQKHFTTLCIRHFIQYLQHFRPVGNIIIQLY